MGKSKIKSDEDEITFDSIMVVIVVEGGMVTKIHSGDASARYVIVDIDNRKVGENSISEHTWPDTQFDDEKVKGLLNDV
jgi:hypothetical protein